MRYLWPSVLALAAILLTGASVFLAVTLARTLRAVTATARRLDRAADVLAGRLPTAESAAVSGYGEPLVEHHEVLLRRLRAR